MKIILPQDFTIAREIYEIFNEKIVVCGSLVDFIEINYQNVKDFDFVILQNDLLDLLNIDKIPQEFKLQNIIFKKAKNNVFKTIYKFYNVDIFHNNIEEDYYFHEEYKLKIECLNSRKINIKKHKLKHFSAKSRLEEYFNTKDY